MGAARRGISQGWQGQGVGSTLTHTGEGIAPERPRLHQGPGGGAGAAGGGGGRLWAADATVGAKVPPKGVEDEVERCLEEVDLEGVRGGARPLVCDGAHCAGQEIHAEAEDVE